MLVEVNVVAKPSSTSCASHPQNLFNLLESCNSITKLKQIHTQIVINGFTQKNFLLVKLLFFYVYSGYLKPALSVFENIEKPSTTVWNQIIKGHGRSETPEKSVECYNRMVETEATPDGYTYSFLLNACARSGLLREGEQVHGRVFAKGYCSNLFVQTNLVNFYAVSGGASRVECARRVFDDMPERNVVSWNTLLKGYVKCGDIDGARRVFDEMPDRNVVSWTTMVAGCAKNGKSKLALYLFHQMRRAHVELDQVALVAALSACAELGDLELGRWIHWYIEEEFYVKNQQLLVSLNNALIHMYASCGVTDEAYEVFKKMPKRSSVSWTTIITGFAKQGHGEEALHVFRRMLSSEVSELRPDEITFIGALCACSHAGLVDEGRHIFKFMTQTLGISPTIEHYGCMVDLLSRAGFLHEAQRLIETMPMKPNEAIWGALLGGCRLHKNAELASNVARKLTFEEDPDQAAGYLVLLSNVYAAAQRWVDVAFVRRRMVQMGVRKPPGRSNIQIDGVIHDFVAGDTTHRHASSIYKMLDEIYKIDTRDTPSYVEEF
ncbi:Tetratricopeptide-like helical domain containing protein [Trema orientale]|uniref:Tetratricopeptide-like helical domain containing protein n=1 Tax=Trema orientale TaxID=63057 RepID=A0A2P5DAM8_TREOI|nr:Tetratricopeptide-like helical domain containing protein [Trema orientale]